MPAYYSIALPVVLRTLFDYLPPEGHGPIAVGARVQVPFGRGNGRILVGVVCQRHQTQELPAKLKRIDKVLDDEPLLDADFISLCQWASHYYQHPIGETIATCLPKKLRLGAQASITYPKHWQLTVQGKGLPDDGLKRAPKQQLALQQLRARGTIADDQLAEHGLGRDSLRNLAQKGLAELTDTPPNAGQPQAKPAPHPLTDEQAAVVSQIAYGAFSVAVLEGATGSGKTEVYLQAIAQVLARGQQAMVLIPEISLGPQTLARFHQRFKANIVALHSGLNDTERAQHWLRARAGDADIVIGTRSAVFTPLPRLGLIVIDEEHDLSFKQQDGLRYSARDLAIVRAQKADVPVILGSATPSLETLSNINHGRFTHWQLHARPGGASHADIELFDIKQESLIDGFSEHALTEIAKTVGAGQQALVFVNRRGFAPTVLCHDCGWQAQCKHCDSNLTAHNHPAHLRCHHCDYQRPPLSQCPECFGQNLLYLGAATEKAEQMLSEHFPRSKVIRIDRDTTGRKNAFDQLLEQVHTGEPCILVGTQMLAKGHHFPNVTLVVVLNADNGLFGADFRASERTGQLLLQVAGRAGRGDHPGRVLIQTHHPDHPLFTQLFSHGYRAFADLLMEERMRSSMPPFSYMAIIKVEASFPQPATALLEGLKNALQHAFAPNPHNQYLGPMPAIMERVNKRFRYVLQLKCSQRKLLHQVLPVAVHYLSSAKVPKDLRWSLDVDPQETP
ncbi:primosomal protein N' [Halioxenophilus aromaticivorans]|uniref:primosomal protein N' n=1 Tax=Halioxenophilus aromaticivorans TaxID=1306992 RepID=UPI0031EBBBF9